MAYERCIEQLQKIAGRVLSDAEIARVFERIHKAALDIKAERVEPGAVKLGGKLGKELGAGANDIVSAAAERAAAELAQEAADRTRQVHLQLVRLGARMGDVERIQATGAKPLDAVEKTIARDYSGRVNVESLEQKATGYQAYFGRKLIETWNALGDDWLGFFQDRTKLLDLVRELRGEDSGNPLAKKGAQVFHDVAEEARQVFNANGGTVGKLDDWGMPQHHSQEKVAAAGKDTWINTILPMLDRSRYADAGGTRWNDAEMSAFLGKAWDTIATNGHANMEPGGFKGAGKMANRHAEDRQIHFKDAKSVIDYWQAFGDRTAVEILMGHTERMARDIAFIEHFGPNPNTTYATLRDAALKEAVVAEPRKTEQLEGRAVALDNLFEYVSGNTKPTYRQWLKATADGIAHLNSAGKLGGAALASFFGDKPMMEAISHLNDLPVLSRWRTEMSLLNPVNAGDRRLIQQQGLMLDSVRSGLQRFYEGLGQSSTTGKLANAVMRMTGMQAINDVRKGAFGLQLMSSIGHQLEQGVEYGKLAESDVRTLKNYGISETDWKTWQIAKLDKLAGVDHVLTPESISRIAGVDLEAAGVIPVGAGPEAAAQVRREAIVKLLGAVNTESEFAIVTPGWRERAQFYGGKQRGTVWGEISRSVLQFKSFPWAFFQRGMDALANMDGALSKTVMGSWLIGSTTLAGAMLMDTRDMLTGKDPRAAFDKDWMKYWGSAFLQGGALGIYGDFLYGINQTRYGSGPIEALSGPTIGPLLELGLVQPLTAAKGRMEGKETHLAAQTIQDLKGFVPGGNIWYTKAAMDHLVWQRVMDALSPGYLANIRSRTMRDYNQDWWWRPGATTPDRAPAFEKAVR